MNKKLLLNKCKDIFYYYDIEVYSECIVFKTWTKDARENNFTQLEHNNKTEKKENYKLLNKFIDSFDFSFYTIFENKQELKDFLEV